MVVEEVYEFFCFEFEVWVLCCEVIEFCSAFLSLFLVVVAFSVAVGSLVPFGEVRDVFFFVFAFDACQGAVDF